MGSSAHMSHMVSALAAHGEELREETWEDVPVVVKAQRLSRSMFDSTKPMEAAGIEPASEVAP